MSTWVLGPLALDPSAVDDVASLVRSALGWLGWRLLLGLSRIWLLFSGGYPCCCGVFDSSSEVPPSLFGSTSTALVLKQGCNACQHPDHPDHTNPYDVGGGVTSTYFMIALDGVIPRGHATHTCESCEQFNADYLLVGAALSTSSTAHRCDYATHTWEPWTGMPYTGTVNTVSRDGWAPTLPLQCDGDGPVCTHRVWFRIDRERQSGAGEAGGLWRYGAGLFIRGMYDDESFQPCRFMASGSHTPVTFACGLSSTAAEVCGRSGITGPYGSPALPCLEGFEFVDAEGGHGVWTNRNCVRCNFNRMLEDGELPPETHVVVTPIAA